MRRALVTAAAVWTAGVVAALFLPADAVPSWIRGSDTVFHGVFFAVSAALLAGAFPGRWTLVSLALLILAAASEIGQGVFLPGRGAEWTDFGADVVGIGAGLALAAAADRVTRRSVATSPRPAAGSRPRA